jgi:hypothetical protein
MFLCGLLALAAAAPASAQTTGGKPTHTHGKVVMVLPTADLIVVRVGEGAQARNIEYKVNKSTRFWGPDRVELKDGLGNAGFAEGGYVWIRTAPGQSIQLIQSLYLYDPALPPGKEP